jgi:hypothetical protein
MRVCLTLFAYWPYVKKCDKQYSVFSAHDVVHDIYLTSTDRVQSLKDILVNGSVLHMFKSLNYKIILTSDCAEYGDPESEFVKDLKDFSDLHLNVNNIDELKNIYDTLEDDENVFVCNIFTKLLVPKISENVSQHVNLNSVLIQKLANEAAYEKLSDMSSYMTNSKFISFSYHSIEISNQEWISTSKSLTVLPKGIVTDMITNNVPYILGKTLMSLGIDISDTDIQVCDDDCAMTLFEENKNDTKFMAYFLHQRQRYTLYCTLNTVEQFFSFKTWPVNCVIHDFSSNNLLRTEWKDGEVCASLHTIFLRSLVLFKRFRTALPRYESTFEKTGLDTSEKSSQYVPVEPENDKHEYSETNIAIVNDTIVDEKETIDEQQYSQTEQIVSKEFTDESIYETGASKQSASKQSEESASEESLRQQSQDSASKESLRQQSQDSASKESLTQQSVSEYVEESHNVVNSILEKIVQDVCEHVSKQDEKNVANEHVSEQSLEKKDDKGKHEIDESNDQKDDMNDLENKEQKNDATLEITIVKDEKDAEESPVEPKNNVDSETTLESPPETSSDTSFDVDWKIKLLSKLNGDKSLLDKLDDSSPYTIIISDPPIILSGSFTPLSFQAFIGMTFNMKTSDAINARFSSSSENDVRINGFKVDMSSYETLNRISVYNVKVSKLKLDSRQATSKGVVYKHHKLIEQRMRFR